ANVALRDAVPLRCRVRHVADRIGTAVGLVVVEIRLGAGGRQHGVRGIARVPEPAREAGNTAGAVLVAWLAAEDVDELRTAVGALIVEYRGLSENDLRRSLAAGIGPQGL